MDRLACIDVPVLPLQILLTRHPEWTDLPAVVVDRDTPQGRVLWVNRHARQKGLVPGARYSEGLSIAADLRAGVVGDKEIADTIETATRELQNLSPRIEASTDLPGVFWADVSGMSLLYPELYDWASKAHEHLKQRGLYASIVIGFSRFGTYATARAERGIRVFNTAQEEQRAARAIRLERLDLAPRLREILAKLGVHTVGTFVNLPASGLLERFGPEAQRLHRLAEGREGNRLKPEAPYQPVQEKLLLDNPVVDVFHILALIKQLLEPTIEQLAARQESVRALHLLFSLDTRESCMETVVPAEPTLEVAILLDLVQLRLHAGRLPAGVREIELRIESVKATRSQLELFASTSKRDLEAAARAFARLRAEFGEQTVVYARLCEGHLPEAGFAWEAMYKLPRAQPRKVKIRPLVRRIKTRSQSLPPRPTNERNGAWLARERPDYGCIVRSNGPYIVSGGWWAAATVHREYHFIETRRGDLLWAYYDRTRRRWYLQGTVE
jgi:protein ImuB